MKVMVTGATGFVGLHCVRQVLAAGHEVRLLVRTPSKLERIYGPFGIAFDDVVEGDMADPSCVKTALEGCDAVIHAAATFYGGDDVLAANVAGVRNVVGGASDLGIDPIIYFSTVGCVFPGTGEMLTVDDPIASFSTTYGKSKAEGERLVREMQDRGAAITSLYPSGIFGPDDPVPGETSKGLRDSLAVVFPETRGGVAIVDVRDLASIAVRCLEPGRGPRRFMTGGHFLTWTQFADLCSALTGRKLRRVRIPGSLMLGLGLLLDQVRRIVPFNYPLTHEAAQYMIHLKPCDSRPVIDAFGIEFRPIEETLVDSIRSLHEAGHIDDRAAGKLAGRGVR